MSDKFGGAFKPSKKTLNNSKSKLSNFTKNAALRVNQSVDQIQPGRNNSFERPLGGGNKGVFSSHE